MRPIPASNDASRGICDENRPVPQQRACFSSQVPAYPIPLNDCSLVLPPLSEYGEGEREGKRRGAGTGAERGTHATGVTTGATGVGGLAGQLAAGARRTSQVTYSAMGSPLATSGRFCRRIQPERPRSGSVSPGQRSRQRTTPAENRTETKDPWQNQGPFPAEPPRSRMATVPCSPDQRHLNAGHPLSVCESFPARLLHGGLQRPDRPSMRSGCPPQDP